MGQENGKYGIQKFDSSAPFFCLPSLRHRPRNQTHWPTIANLAEWACNLTLDLADVSPADAVFSSRPVFTYSSALPEFLKPTRQPLSDVLGVVVGVVVVRGGGQRISSPKLVEHELFLGDAYRAVSGSACRRLGLTSADVSEASGVRKMAARNVSSGLT